MSRTIHKAGNQECATIFKVTKSLLHSFLTARA